MSRLLGVPEAAAVPWRALLEQAAEQGTPCAGTARDDWTGSPAQQERAAVACLDCPVLAACLAYADAAREKQAVWGGYTAAQLASRHRAVTNARPAQLPQVAS